jgi:hypothetical protein
MAPLLTVLAACGGQAQSLADAGPASAPDAATADEPTTHTSFLTVIHGGGTGCMPKALAPDAQGQVPCSIFELTASATACDGSLGLSAVDPSVTASVQAAAFAPASQLVCQLAQLPESAWVNGSCVASAAAGWCYVTGAAAGGGCAQAIRFSPSGSPSAGVEVVLGCLE